MTGLAEGAIREGTRGQPPEPSIRRREPAVGIVFKNPHGRLLVRPVAVPSVQYLSYTPADRIHRRTRSVCSAMRSSDAEAGFCA